jgi:hypothetical protein
MNAGKADPPRSYEYAGALAMVELHERHLWRFLQTWKEARAGRLALPQTDDPDYASLEALLRHVCAAARGYMVWMCDVLRLPDPEITPAPDPEVLGSDAEGYVNHVLERWRVPLARVQEERFHRPEYPAPWRVNYCVDAMLEHAVMHPIRHGFQLRKLLDAARAAPGSRASPPGPRSRRDSV